MNSSWAASVYRGYEEEFDKKVNGYDVGDTICIRKPQQFGGAHRCRRSDLQESPKASSR